VRTADVAIATITRVRGRADERLVAQSLERLDALGVPIIVSDRGSSTTFLSRLRRLPSVQCVDPQGATLVGQVQASISRAHATGRRWILYTEPDKGRFFEQGLIEFIGAAPNRRDVGVILAARSPEGFSTFPEYQRRTEAAANELCGIVLQSQADYFYGPFLLSRELARIVARIPPTLGWGWRPFVFATACNLGYRLASITGHYECPAVQRREAGRRARLHRRRQLLENVQGVITAVGLRD
jgi:hypothetical protein